MYYTMGSRPILKVHIKKLLIIYNEVKCVKYFIAIYSVIHTVICK